MIFRSESMVYQNDRYTVPVWVLDTDTQTVIYTNPETFEEQHWQFHTDHIRYHLHYCEEYRPERLQSLVNSGEIYKYLDELDTKVTDALMEQAEILMNADSDYKTALETGNLYEVERIGNMCREQAKEPIFNAMVYV